jgi:hypothetical protein
VSLSSSDLATSSHSVSPFILIHHSPVQHTAVPSACFHHSSNVSFPSSSATISPSTAEPMCLIHPRPSLSEPLVVLIHLSLSSSAYVSPSYPIHLFLVLQPAALACLHPS